MAERYEVGIFRVYEATANRVESWQLMRCLRCRRPVTWLTRHAAERHGDDVVVVPDQAMWAHMVLW